MQVPVRNRQLTKIKSHGSRAARHTFLPLQRFLHTETTGALILLASGSGGADAFSSAATHGRADQYPKLAPSLGPV